MAKVGRPTLYKKKYCKELKDYFTKSLRESKLKQVATASGKTADIENEEAADLPTIAGFAVSIDTYKSNLYEWAKKNPEFSDALNYARSVQEHFIITHSIKGDYNSTISKLMLMNNHGYKDKIEQEISGEGIQINYTKVSK